MENKKNSVLIVDDEADNITILSLILGPEYTIYTANNGKQAIDIAEEHIPDVILLDILMPEMDGYEVITTLKKSEITKDIPVIFITGLSDDDDEKKGWLLGASDYITKPFSKTIVKLRVQHQIKIINQTRMIIEKELAEKINYTKIGIHLRMNNEMLTPMNAIIGVTQILKMTCDSDDLAENLGEIEASAYRLLELINDLLDISDNNDKVLALNEDTFSFDEMFRDVLKRIGSAVTKKKQSLTFDVSSSIPELLFGDEKRLAKVINNLLMNSVWFTPEEGKIHFSAAVIGEDQEKVILQVEVADNGIGIPKDQENVIFDIFEQADISTTRDHDGIGLGLPISKLIVEMMEGKLSVESEVNKGSKFIFTCKLKKR
jgi:two-component system sensor histidine kinase/response regulator